MVAFSLSLANILIRIIIRRLRSVVLLLRIRILNLISKWYFCKLCWWKNFNKNSKIFFKKIKFHEKGYLISLCYKYGQFILNKSHCHFQMVHFYSKLKLKKELPTRYFSLFIINNKMFGTPILIHTYCSSVCSAYSIIMFVSLFLQTKYYGSFQFKGLKLR